MKSKIVETPHEIKVYEETVYGLTRVLIGKMTVYTKDRDNVPPAWRNVVKIEVSQ